jgi:hypothetical protein
MRAIIQGGSVIASLGERILGRTTAEDLVNAKTGEVIVKAGTLLDEAMVKAIEEAESSRPRSARRWSARPNRACAARATGATSRAALRSTSARRSA